MIYYLVTRAHSYTLREYLASAGSSIEPVLRGKIKILPYEDLEMHRHLNSGTYIFSDIERLTVHETLRASMLRRVLQTGLSKVLNDPLTSMRRYELLRTLHHAGINHFNVYRLTECRQPQKFPVFIRNESDHKGSNDQLLHSASELADAIDHYLATNHTREDTIIEEFCDTSDQSGVFRKYAAFRIGDKIIAAHLDFAEKWMVKRRNLLENTPHILEEEMNYVSSNPHQQELLKIFQLARIEYGRIDYSIKDGRLQVWEINTNPMHMPQKIVAPEWRPVHRELHTAFLNIDTSPSSFKIPNPLWKSRAWRVAKSLKGVLNAFYRVV